MALTWAAGDTATMTINGKDLVVTVGATGTSTANVAIAIKEAWESASRLNATQTTDATSNAGGQEFGEFSEVSASVSGSVVTLVANKAGKPFTLTVADGTVGNGSLTGAVTQTATGKNYWSDADNWDTGTVPVSDDTVVFKDSDVSCKYGLPNASTSPLEVTIQVWMSYTGEVGLPPVNADDPNKTYYEYRQRYVRLDDDGGSSDIKHRFGLGKDGTGCRLFNLHHKVVKCSPVIYNTGTPLVSRVGSKALNICCEANTSTIGILNGSVEYGSQDGGTSAFLTVNQAGGDSRCLTGIHTSGSNVTCSGGTMLIGQSGAIVTIYNRGGTIRLENQTGTITSLYVLAGTVEYASTATISNLYLYSSGVWDARFDVGVYVLSATSVYAGSSFLDPYNRTSAPSNFKLYYDPSDKLQFGANVTDYISIVP